MAGGKDRQMAALRQSLGDLPARNFLLGRRRRPHREISRRRGKSAGALDSRPRREGCCPRHTGRRIRWRDGGLPPALGIGGGRGFRFAGLQCGGLLQGGGGESFFRNHQQSPVSQRRAGGGQATSPIATVLLHLLLPTGHDSNSTHAGKEPRRFSKKTSRCSSTIPILPSRWPN